MDYQYIAHPYTVVDFFFSLTNSACLEGNAILAIGLALLLWLQDNRVFAGGVRADIAILWPLKLFFVNSFLLLSQEENHREKERVEREEERERVEREEKEEKEAREGKGERGPCHLRSVTQALRGPQSPSSRLPSLRLESPVCPLCRGQVSALRTLVGASAPR